MNENYAHPEMPKGAEAGIIKGMYLLTDARQAEEGSELRVQLLGSRHDPARSRSPRPSCSRRNSASSADIWCCPSFTELRRDGFDAERWNRLHPEGEAARSRTSTECLDDRAGPGDRRDRLRARLRRPDPRVHADGKRYTVLGTDGFGRSDTRANLRAFFEVDRYYIAHAAIAALAAEGKMNPRMSRARSSNGSSIRTNRTR